ncbi:MAG: calcium-binding protein, partial [Caulobacteraceae bacterium]
MVAIINGTSGDDTLAGGKADNVVNGLDGNDLLTDIEGDNTLNGGIGDDTLIGGEGRDTLDGGDGVDTVSYATSTGAVTVDLRPGGSDQTGSMGRDTWISIENLIGSDFNDTLFGLGGGFVNGGGGNDVVAGDGSSPIELRGGAGDDSLAPFGADATLNGGDGVDSVDFTGVSGPLTLDLAIAGSQSTGFSTVVLSAIENINATAEADTLAGDDGANAILGNAGADTIAGRGGADNLSGDVGDDSLSGGDGGDQINAGDGNDTVEGGAGDDTMAGGLDADTLVYASASAGVTADLSVATSQDTGGAGIDHFTEFENLLGSVFNDRLTGDGGANAISGAGGADTVEGGLGDDTLSGGNGVDTLSYAHSGLGVKISLAKTTAQITGGAGLDIVSEFENLTGSALADSLTGNGSDNLLDGGAGKDKLDGGGGADTAVYANAASGVVVDLAAGKASGGGGNDSLLNIEIVVGTAFADRLTGDINANTLNGGAGDDVLEGGDGGDSLIGGEGQDTASYASAIGAVTVDLLARTGTGTAGA